MNNQLQSFARQTLLDGLASLPEDWLRTFNLMYGMDDGRRTVEDATAMPIEAVVAEIPEEKLDWAMQQVERSLVKLSGARMAQK